MRRVKRRWYSKKKQIWVEKEYVYEHGKSTKGKILVNKEGKVNEKNLKKYIDSINSNTSLSETDKKELTDLLSEIVHNRQYKKKELTTSGFASLKINNPIERMFSNAGYSVDDVVNEYGFDRDELLNEENWKGSVYMGEWEFIFTYTGSIFKHI